MPFTSDWRPSDDKYQTPCRECGSKDVQEREWESSCGGYEDWHYRCLDCGRVWWVDGADA